MVWYSVNLFYYYKVCIFCAKVIYVCHNFFKIKQTFILSGCSENLHVSFTQTTQDSYLKSSCFRFNIHNRPFTIAQITIDYMFTNYDFRQWHPVVFSLYIGIGSILTLKKRYMAALNGFSDFMETCTWMCGRTTAHKEYQILFSTNYHGNSPRCLHNILGHR